MERIASFQVDHNQLQPGMYLSGWVVAERRGLDGFAVGGAVRVGLGSGCTAFAAGLGGWIGAGTSALRTGLPGLGGEGPGSQGTWPGRHHRHGDPWQQGPDCPMASTVEDWGVTSTRTG